MGSTTNDRVGDDYITALANGNYVVSNSRWDNGVATDAGAVTWGDGTSGVTGTVSTANSLVRSTADEGFLSYVTELANGNYVVSSPEWANGAAADAGAVTWGDGTKGVTGTVSAANSLVGSTAGDQVGSYEFGWWYGVTALANGNYVVGSPKWHNGAASYAGAVTWGDGKFGTTGPITADNSVRV